MLGPIELQRLPGPAKQELIQLLHAIEEHCLWPQQIFMVIASILPKPKGGDRILGLLPHLVRLWSRLRSQHTADWSEALCEHWVTAVRGSSALQAALIRSCMDESCRELGIASSTLLLDLEKFYDSLSFSRLCASALQQGFPPQVLALEVQMFMAPRHLKDQNSVSKEIIPQRSVVAGSLNGGRLAKAFLGPLM